MTKYINLIRKITWSFHRTTGIEWNELFSEACLAYCEAANSFDDSKTSKESSWMFSCIQNQLTNFCKIEQRNNKASNTLEYPVREWMNPSSPENPTYEFYFDDPTLALSNDVQLIIKMARKNPTRYNRIGLTNRTAIGNIRKDLRGKKNWTFPRINKAMQDLRLELLN